MNASEYVIVPREPTEEMVEAIHASGVAFSQRVARGLAANVIAAAPAFPWPTTEEAVAILNERRHRVSDGWRVQPRPNNAPEILPGWSGIGISEFEARAVALAYTLGMPE